MGQKINLNKYIAEVKSKMGIAVPDEIIEKDLILTLLLAEFEKLGIGKELIFKGGTLLSRNYLNYHRFSEDLDFVYRESGELRNVNRTAREKRIKLFIDKFTPALKKAADSLGMEFSINRSDSRFCSILHGRVVYIFRVYYSENRFIKVEINFVEKMLYPPEEIMVRAITDFFDSRELMFTLGLNINNFRVPSYSLEEITLEKFRALLTRNEFKERDLFDLFLIRNSLMADAGKIVDKIESSSLIKKGLEKLIAGKLLLLEKGEFFRSTEKIGDLAIIKYNPAEFERFKKEAEGKLMQICKRFLKK
ncbi:MAG: nucleotidyl transferase AbiEii/AbiGii toxin family protein [Nanoarchaeota archaeon]